MFVRYNVGSYSFPEISDTFNCPDALEELELDPSSGWKCAYLTQCFMKHKPGFLVVFRTVDSEKDEFYVEKAREGKGKKVSKFKKAFKEADTDRLVPMPDDDASDKVICYLDDKTRIATNSYCFKIQMLEKVKDGQEWKSAWFYSSLAEALKGYMKHATRAARGKKARPTVQDLYNLVVDVYKKVEVAIARL